MSPEVQKLTILHYVMLPLTNLHWSMTLYRHVSIWHEFCAAALIQTIIETETASFGWTNVGHMRWFFECGYPCR